MSRELTGESGNGRNIAMKKPNGRLKVRRDGFGLPPPPMELNVHIRFDQQRRADCLLALFIQREAKANERTTNQQIRYMLRRAMEADTTNADAR